MCKGSCFSDLMMDRENKASENIPGGKRLPADDGTMISEVCAMICASASMRSELEKLFHYADLFPGGAAEKVIGDLSAEKVLPCGSRAEGKKALREIKKRIIRDTSLTETFIEGSGERKSSAETFTIFVEERALEYPVARQIIEKHPGARIIRIRHYKDIFDREKEEGRKGTEPYRETGDESGRPEGPERPGRPERPERPVRPEELELGRPEGPGRPGRSSVILAVQTGRKIYPGAPVCQSFGNRWFYYSSSVLNCPFDCGYCYLKGKYPSDYTVIFVNIEDYFAETEKLLAEHPVYMSVSYDTDLLALENLTGFVSKWAAFAASSPGLTIEIRTKSGRKDIFGKLASGRNIIFSFTISPDYISEKYEHGAAPVKARLAAAQAAMDAGFPVRLCFDPLLVFPHWREGIRDMIKKTAGSIDLTKVMDFSVGSFRISSSYLKRMRRAMPHSEIAWFPYDLTGSYYHYPSYISDEMEEFAVSELEKYVPAGRIYRWE